MIDRPKTKPPAKPERKPVQPSDLFQKSGDVSRTGPKKSK